MSQEIFSSIDPSISGTELAGVLNDFKDAIVSGMSGTTRPTELQPGGYWVDTSNDPTTWSFKLWTGVDDVEVFEIDLATGGASVSLAVDSFVVRKVSADTVGAILNLVKRRIATSGQVLSGDVVGEIRMVGRDNSGTDPIVAKIMFTAGENQTSSAYGGTLSFYSTPAGTATLVEHMRFIGGVVETLVALKLNAQELVGQNVATAATISQLSAAKVLVEFTGATATYIQGLNSTHASKVVNLHNRSSANVTLKHQDSGASAADRLILPEDKDVVLLPQDSATLYYCTTDTRWKILYASARFAGFTTTKIYGNIGSWQAPASVEKVRMIARAKSSSMPKNARTSSENAFYIIDAGKSVWGMGVNLNGDLGDNTSISKSSPVAVVGNLKFVSVSMSQSNRVGVTENGSAYAWGTNPYGELGTGNTTWLSSPAAVVGGIKFKKVLALENFTVGLSVDGDAYAWGLNNNGSIGDGTTGFSKSSPVLVVGGLKFRDLQSNGDSVLGLTIDGAMYGWGTNENGELGIGDTTPRSSPVAVLGGLNFASFVMGPDRGFAYVYALTADGTAYAWGNNLYGQLGVGDGTDRSSPVAVVGGLKFKELKTTPVSGNQPRTFALTEDGTAYGWGYDWDGLLGVGGSAPASSPTQVLGSLKFKKLEVAQGSFYGITEDGELYSWGTNSQGQLGVGDVTERSSPVIVLGSLSYQDVFSMSNAFNGNSAYGLTTDGRLFAWGDNNHGKLGLGDITLRSSPVLVLGNLSLKTQDDSDTILDISVVGGNTYALKLGDGPCFFGSRPIGNNIQQVEITYVP